MSKSSPKPVVSKPLNDLEEKEQSETYRSDNFEEDLKSFSSGARPGSAQKTNFDTRKGTLDQTLGLWLFSFCETFLFVGQLEQYPHNQLEHAFEQGSGSR
eukprot:CAMPEP_0201538198 /NCGR_PEP_ID=MMETSP0161_2-20130828/66954_1 /ASSEMBLY_ACC=CAM_ASM_000251 /TAXON_ID=180227 /ORGANISM="Neoparamoeba aestuarina, Strain SoJaBio B1-5/56/2" /LENGTH=99 /DNA_ID=CAMNT_0047944913 /DNA_START=42 /DNA_END=342 /DNA_ORIENTATION=-